MYQQFDKLQISLSDYDITLLDALCKRNEVAPGNFGTVEISAYYGSKKFSVIQTDF